MAYRHLTDDDIDALRALVAYPTELPRWGDADLVVVCPHCHEVAVCSSKIGIPGCACGGKVVKAPEMEALLAAFRIGGWEALVAAARELVEQARK